MSDHSQNQENAPGEYDRLASQFGYVLPEAIFGLCHEYLKPGQRLLDIGIGTGLSAAPFHSFGMKITGIDNDPALLAFCAAKDLSVELKPVDVTIRPWPFPDAFFDHAIACGISHFIPELEPIFAETSRLLRAGGVFAFTVKEPPSGGAAGTAEARCHTEWIDGMQIYSHTRKYCDKLLTSSGFLLQKQLTVLLTRGKVDQNDPYRVMIAQKH